MRIKFGFLVALAFSISILLSACGNNLDRNAASNLISKQYPTVITKSFNLHEAVFGVNTYLDSKSGYKDFTESDKTRIAVFEERLARMKSAGFIDYKKEKIVKQFFSQRLGNMIYEITPTDKMSALIHKRSGSSVEVIVGLIEFDEVTGIIELAENAKKVEYTTKPIFNEIAGYFEINDYERTPSNRSAHFAKYDDGWRVE